MTRDEFESRYRLLQEVTSEGGATTHHALGPAGAVVMVHFLHPSTASRVEALLAGPEDARPDRILKAVEVEGSSVLVTKFIMDFRDLEHWLDSEGAPDAPTGSDATPPARSGEPGPPVGHGNRTPSAPATPPTRPTPTTPRASGAPPEEAASGSGGEGEDAPPGEFTRMFAALDEEGEPAAPPPEPGAPSPGDGGGET
ncbi:MAG TPA: hypothetical protein VLL48_11830, partial [Longimicrobiales bacterium]|nr:hypothetical protein [Longimicrobiales bacterium]